MENEVLIEIFALDMDFKLLVLFGAIITFFGTFFGSISGLGGGMIIKPLYNSLLGMITPIGIICSKFASSVIVLSNSVATVNTHKNNKFNLNMKIAVPMSIGVVIGVFFVDYLPNVPVAVELILQSLLYVSVCIVVYVRDKVKRYDFTENILIILIIGLAMGFISAFFGIGGGAIKVPFLILFLNMDVKKAGTYSFLIALMSEPFKIYTYGRKILYYDFGFEIIKIIILFSLIMVPVAFFGGVLGSKVQMKLSEKKVAIMFNSIIIFFAAISLYQGLIQLAK